MLLFGCATNKTRIESTVNSFTEYNIKKSDPHYFNTDKMSIPDKQVASECKKAAIAVGINVVESKCKDCKTIVIKSNVIGTRNDGEVSSLAGYNNSMLVTQTTRVTDREIDIQVFEGSDELLASKINSSGYSSTIAPVAFEMCIAGFLEYPNDMTGKHFYIEAKKQK